MKTTCESYCSCQRNTCLGNPPTSPCGIKPLCAKPVGGLGQ
jgi:hypothetical protein